MTSAARYLLFLRLKFIFIIAFGTLSIPPMNRGINVVFLTFSKKMAPCTRAERRIQDFYLRRSAALSPSVLFRYFRLYSRTV